MPSKTVVHIHPGGQGIRGKRILVVRAPTSPEEQAFFLKIKKAMSAPTMSDLIRHCCVRIALEEELEIEIPEAWRALYGIE